MGGCVFLANKQIFSNSGKIVQLFTLILYEEDPKWTNLWVLIKNWNQEYSGEEAERDKDA